MDIITLLLSNCLCLVLGWKVIYYCSHEGSIGIGATAPLYVSCTSSTHNLLSPHVLSLYEFTRLWSIFCSTWWYRFASEPMASLSFAIILSGSLSANYWSSIYSPHSAIAVISRGCSLDLSTGTKGPSPNPTDSWAWGPMSESDVRVRYPSELDIGR